MHLQDLLLNLPAGYGYESLEEAVIKQIVPSDRSCLQQLFKVLQLGNGRPSDLLLQTQQLLGRSSTDETILRDALRSTDFSALKRSSHPPPPDDWGHVPSCVDAGANLRLNAVKRLEISTGVIENSAIRQSVASPVVDNSVGEVREPASSDDKRPDTFFLPAIPNSARSVGFEPATSSQWKMRISTRRLLPRYLAYSSFFECHLALTTLCQPSRISPMKLLRGTSKHSTIDRSGRLDNDSIDHLKVVYVDGDIIQVPLQSSVTDPSLTPSPSPDTSTPPAPRHRGSERRVHITAQSVEVVI
ncbi:uncharacterized protein DEA37_0008958 [Paragonimus westermani]|uniref:Uncharacterized protein n=1 Tax=Paragonimus westermani TaxID=34504 RepID=A0A5J4NR51_9TREM|nr:uncharacterized protein DEA37_0008958 [Paragonimus westermani]